MTIAKQNQQQLVNEKITYMHKVLSGKFGETVWDFQDSFFVELVGKSNQKIEFGSISQPYIRQEVQFFLADLCKKHYKMSTIVNYSRVIFKFTTFLGKHPSKIKSLKDVSYEQFEIKWKTFLVKNNVKETPSYKTAIRSLINAINDLYDTRNETEKDVWDFRKITGARYSKHRNDYLLDFNGVSPLFRESVKGFFRFLLTNQSRTTMQLKLISLRFFLKWFEDNFSSIMLFKDLTRDLMEEYLVFLRREKGTVKAHFFNGFISFPIEYLEYLQRTEHPMAPKKSISTLVYREDFKNRRHEKVEDTIKYIPEWVIQQLKEVLDTDPDLLSPPMAESERKIVPIVIILLASGMRISDVLNLRYDNCLLEHQGAYYLQGDIVKIEVKKHRIPLEDDIVQLVQIMVEEAIKSSNSENNPEKFLFPAMSVSRKGQPVAYQEVRKALNNWAKRYLIKDDNGQIYHFKNHAFRHTKAVELVNSGMNLLHIQKWMAHASPEMTLVYAKILDTTLREEWLKAKENNPFSAVKLNLKNGNVEDLEENDMIEWEYIKHNLEAAKVPMGYCMASRKMACPFVETPCLTCNSFCTTPENLPEFDIEINHTKDLVEKTKDMPIWNDKNQKRLDKLVQIRETLAKGRIHHPSGKKARELPKSM